MLIQDRYVNEYELESDVLKKLVDDAADDAAAGSPGGLYAGTVYAAYAVSSGNAA